MSKKQIGICILVVLVVLGIGFLIGLYTQRDFFLLSKTNTPKIHNVVIQEAINVPERTKGFLGIWEGVWGKETGLPGPLWIPATIAITRIDDAGVDIRYAWEKNYLAGINESGELSGKGELGVDKNTLSVTFTHNEKTVTIRMRLKDDNTLQALWQQINPSSDEVVTATFIKQ